MHYQNPPLIHRDLKVRLPTHKSRIQLIRRTEIQVENILLSPPNTFKLCDFGSTTIPLARVPTAVNEIQALEADINRTTTLQYRAPELVDVWSRKGYDEKIGSQSLETLGESTADLRLDLKIFGRLACSCTSCATTRHPSRSTARSPS